MSYFLSAGYEQALKELRERLSKRVLPEIQRGDPPLWRWTTRPKMSWSAQDHDPGDEQPREKWTWKPMTFVDFDWYEIEETPMSDIKRYQIGDKVEFSPGDCEWLPGVVIETCDRITDRIDANQGARNIVVRHALGCVTLGGLRSGQVRYPGEWLVNEPVEVETDAPSYYYVSKRAWCPARIVQKTTSGWHVLVDGNRHWYPNDRIRHPAKPADDKARADKAETDLKGQVKACEMMVKELALVRAELVKAKSDLDLTATAYAKTKNDLNDLRGKLRNLAS